MKKAKYAMIGITAVFLCVLLGIFVGRHTARTYIPLNNDSNISTEEASVAQTGKININTATEDELQLLPGIGAVLAQRIIDYRHKNGPFSDISKLLLVEGIGKNKLNDIQNYITTGG